jgi:polar amino acid transport system substrate-binding protein
MKTSLLILAAALPLAAADLAPTGTLRAVYLGDNPVQGKMDPKTGTVTGPVADLVKELARRLGVSYQLIPAQGGRDMIDRLNAKTADIGFLAYEASRAQEVDFSRPYLMMFSSYLVRAGSPLKKSADADRAGVKVAVVKGQSQELFLSQNLKAASVKVLPATPPAEELRKMLAAGEVDAYGANRQRQEEVAARFPDLRVLTDNFYANGQAIILRKGDTAGMAVINQFVKEMIESGAVKNSIDHAKLGGVEVAK